MGRFFTVVAVSCLVVTEARATPRSVADCDALVRAQPRALASYRCYWDLAHTGRQSEAERGLEAILRREPENPGALHFLGLCRDGRGLLSQDLLRRSIAAYQRAGDAEGEGYARISLFGVECLASRACDENLELLDAVDTLAREHALPDLQALSLVYRAGAATMNDDVGAAERHLRKAESVIGPGGPSWLRARVLERFGILYLEAGRHAEAYEKFQALAELTRAAAPGRHAAALGYLGTVGLQLAQRHQLDGAEAERLLRDALEAEDRSGLELHSRFSGSLVTRVQLAFLRGPGEDTLADLERVHASDQRRESQYPFVALWLLARFTYDHQPSALPRALSYVDTSLRRCFRPSHAWERAHGLLVRGDLLWRGGDRPRGVADVRAALETFEHLRGRQPEASVRARYGASTAFAHQLAAGWLLDPARGTPEPEAAFEIMERLRARVLFENLLAARGQRELSPELKARGTDLHQRISRLQRRLLDPTLGQQRAEVRRELEDAEAEEIAWKDDVARALPEFRTLEFAPTRLADVQRLLGPEEGMLLFQTWTREPTPEAPYDDGSSWVLAATRDSVRAYRIPDADQLQPAIDQWLALLERRDGSEREGAARLHRDLLAQALGGFPEAIRHLVVVPDGPLHVLPFDALLDPARDRLIAERYAVSVAPSATLWRQWRGSEPGERTGTLLALADPELPHRAGTAVGETWRQTGFTLAALPRARDEARSAAAAGAPGSALRLGAEASEYFLKSADLRPFDVLHLATHAVVDVEAPERSAVVLAPGAEGEDGLLQSREISALDLDHAVVVLAACRSASGLGLRGEGVVGLGRSFFEARAQAVVGSLWSLRDDESSALLDPFYGSLAHGASLAEAMAEARRERIRAGDAPAAWAGMIVLGDGAIRPLAQRRAEDRARALWTVALSAVAGLALLSALRIRA